MKKQTVAVLAAIFALALCAPAIFSGEQKAEQKEDIASLIKGKCLACHDMKRTCSEIGEADAEEWKHILGRMVKKGAKLDEAEAKKMTEYLSALKEAKALCP